MNLFNFPPSYNLFCRRSGTRTTRSSLLLCPCLFVCRRFCVLFVLRGAAGLPYRYPAAHPPVPGSICCLTATQDEHTQSMAQISPHPAPRPSIVTFAVAATAASAVVAVFCLASPGGGQQPLVAVQQRHPRPQGDPLQNRHVPAAAEAERAPRVDPEGADEWNGIEWNRPLFGIFLVLRG